MKLFPKILILNFVMLFIAAVVFPGLSIAETAKEINDGARKSLSTLIEKSERAQDLSKRAKGILVFPSILKAGFLVGGQYGEGALLVNGKTVGYYNTVAVSYGLQIGAQKYGYALFFMTDAALKYLDKSDGWELGTAPNIVIVNTGAAGGISTTSAQSDMYAFFFDQKGLMAGIGLQGTKVTKIDRY